MPSVERITIGSMRHARAREPAKPEIPTTDWPEEMLTIEPPPAVTMWGIPYLQLQKTLPVSALNMITFHSSVVYSTRRLMFEPTSIVGAALRLIQLGQLKGQLIIRNLTPLISRLADDATRRGVGEMAGFAPGLEIASMRHAAMDARLFRS